MKESLSDNLADNSPSENLIDNFDKDDLLDLLKLTQETANSDEIKKMTTMYLNQFKDDHKMIHFFKQVQDRLLNMFENKNTGGTYGSDSDVSSTDNEEDTKSAPNSGLGIGADHAHEYGASPTHNVVIEDKHGSMVMHFKKNDKIESTTNIPIVKDNLNPHLHPTTTCTIYIDSAHRPYTYHSAHKGEYHAPSDISTNIPIPGSPTFNTNFFYTPIESPIQRVVSMKLQSINIPSTWYAFDYKLGNTAYILYSSVDGITWTILGASAIPDGNYTKSGLLSALTTSMNTLYGAPCIEYSIEAHTGRLMGKALDKHLRVEYFSDELKSALVYGAGQAMTHPKKNRNIGRSLGIRRVHTEQGVGFFDIHPTPNLELLGEAPIDVYGARYFFLIVDDFSNHHVHQNLVASKQENIIPNERFDVSDKSHILAQIHLPDITSVRGNGVDMHNHYAAPFIRDDISIQSNIRKYFGPIKIDKFHVKLIDATGELVDLHDHDWSFSIILEKEYKPH